LKSALELGNNAFWILPADQQITFTTNGEALIHAIRLDAKALMVEFSSSNSADTVSELYVETDEVSLAVAADAGGTVTVHSGVDQHAAGPGVERFSLRLI